MSENFGDDGFPPPPPPPPPPSLRPNFFQRAWARFRSWPLWAQIPVGTLVGLFLLSLAISPFVEEDEPDTETTAADVAPRTEPRQTTERQDERRETTTSTQVRVTTTSSPTTTSTSTTSTTITITTTTTTPAGPGKELRISVWDETSARPADDLEIWTSDHGSWFPDLRFGVDGAQSFGLFPVGQPSEFFIYPDGRAGVEIRVEFTMTSEMQSGSDRDMVGVDVYDDRVEVFGSCLPGFEVKFAR